MAQQENQLEQLKFCCSICLDLLKDPVTIPCGHSYCMNCIKGFWDGEDQKGIHSCPQCRKTFTPRPVLEKNTMLADLLEELKKKAGLQAAPADHCYAGPEDVACDFCSGRKLKAIKSCLFCLASFCEKHLQPHYDSPTFKKHKLVEPSKNLQENICSRHDEVMKMFCRTDQKSICYLCSVEEHKGHDTVSAAAERTERQRELEGRRQQIQQRVQDQERKVKRDQEEVENINTSADKTVEVCEKIFTELIRLIQKRSPDVKKLIRSKQETEVSRAKKRQEKLEREITELKKEDDELKQLSHTEDDVQFLQNYSPPKYKLGFPQIDLKLPVFYNRYLEDVKAAASEAASTVEDILQNGWRDISLAEAEVDSSSSSPQKGSKTRAELLKFSQEISLDPNSANEYLSVDLGNKRAVKKKDAQSISKGLERFESFGQVLSRKTLTERCYWEVERSGRCTVAVAYKDISRRGRLSAFGRNENSWALECCQIMYLFRHNNTLTLISGPVSSRVGVYLDHRAGVLSFYSISETMTLLHRVQTTFTQPLHAGLQLYETGDTAELREPELDA
ncbi:E3 ubiquitin/ISG15 ligase TRIM25-like [Leuresthes tenuis]|uniref:E3 ubiquitin/ISG15 ligase TRIM25-like n=1 Tax=Leuresthes tenuis TaxID=355514 RepID=UPI003B502C10